MIFNRPSIKPHRILNCTKHPITLHSAKDDGQHVTLPASPNPVRTKQATYVSHYVNVAALPIAIVSPNRNRSIIGLPEPDDAGPLLIIVSKNAARGMLDCGYADNTNYLIMSPAMQLRGENNLVAGARSLELHSTWLEI